MTDGKNAFTLGARRNPVAQVRNENFENHCYPVTRTRRHFLSSLGAEVEPITRVAPRVLFPRSRSFGERACLANCSRQRFDKFSPRGIISFAIDRGRTVESTIDALDCFVINRSMPDRTSITSVSLHLSISLITII